MVFTQPVMLTTTKSPTERLIDELYRVEGKAEIVNGEIVHLMATGYRPNYAAGEIFVNLRRYVRRTGRGLAVTDNAAFVVDLPHRKSFSPDAAYHVGRPTDMKFLEGAPVFAVEVRSEGDYGEGAEAEMAAKRDDYFAAGTQVVWDVDGQGEPTVRKYVAASPRQPTLFHVGEVADAEPALPGWTMRVADLSLPR